MLAELPPVVGCTDLSLDGRPLVRPLSLPGSAWYRTTGLLMPGLRSCIASVSASPRPGVWPGLRLRAGGVPNSWHCSTRLTRSCCCPGSARVAPVRAVTWPSLLGKASLALSWAPTPLPETLLGLSPLSAALCWLIMLYWLFWLMVIDSTSCLMKTWLAWTCEDTKAASTFVLSSCLTSLRSSAFCDNQCSRLVRRMDTAAASALDCKCRSTPSTRPCMVASSALSCKRWSNSSKESSMSAMSALSSSFRSIPSNRSVMLLKSNASSSWCSHRLRRS
mmetsp:Transcript_34199/g.106732  ORF Transcript_34199/g.106732 Transcript_34199/m.106732 type:complete len:277 (+) Transcript_34199:387-1217(+)